MKRNSPPNGAIGLDAPKIGIAETHRNNLPATPASVLSIVVPYTTLEQTRAALRHSAVCSDLDVRVSLVDIQVVPFPCSLDHPPIDRQYSRGRLQDLLHESRLQGQAVVLYTRDWFDAFRRVLGPESLVVLATRKGWWPTREQKLARALTNAGHQVMLLPVRGE